MLSPWGQYDFQAYTAVGWSQRHSEEGGQQRYVWITVEREDKNIAANYTYIR